VRTYLRFIRGGLWLQKWLVRRVVWSLQINRVTVAEEPRSTRLQDDGLVLQGREVYGRLSFGHFSKFGLETRELN
jgi:hypothetical protein